MKQIIPFKKDLPFKTKVSDITSISLERKIEILDGGIVTGTFYITGDYKMNEGSINREKFSFDLPFDITLDPRYDVNSVKADIEDFYYDVINEDTLKVNIDLYIEAEYLPDTSLDNNILTEEDKSDNESKADLIVAVGTGEVPYVAIAGSILLIMISITVGIYVIKKKHE